ncbi:MAG: beta-ketoacyl-ACP reductase [Actinobacteria bacterium]|nr:beta-ketoacyl-ACP reductase [Actinomycetota bacterium]
MSRVVLITGGSKGIGLACAKAFAALGDKVAITYNSTPPPPEFFGVKCDVTDTAQVDAAFAAVEEHFGTVEVLVSNAGITKDTLLLRMKEADFAEVIDANLTAAFRVVKRATPGMLKARSGRIILMSSVVGLLGSAGQANYSASKAGLVGFARSLARELGSRSITVNVVAPGPVETDMTAALTAEQLQTITSSVPLQRMATPEEVAGVVAFLASQPAAYITGAVIPVDGGLGMGH